MRDFLSFLAALVITVAPARADQILGPGRVDNAGKVLLPGGLTLGKWQGGKYTATPDVLDAGRILGDGSGIKARAVITGAVDRIVAEKLFERLSINDFYQFTDGLDYLPALNRAVAALPDSGGTIYLPRREGCYPVSNVVVIGNGSASGPSTKQNVRLVGDTGSGTGGQTGVVADKGTCIKYGGASKIAAILQFNGPMAMGLEGIVLEAGYLGYSVSPTASTTSGSKAVTAIASMNNVVVGARVTGNGIPAGTIVTAISGSTATLSNAATAGGIGVLTFDHNQSTVDNALLLNHVFRSTVRNVGLRHARIGMRQDSYSAPNGFVVGSNDSSFDNIWCENTAIAGGSAGAGCFDIGGSDATDILDVARNTYTNLVGIYAGDPNARGITLRYTDNLTFRGGMMYSQREPGLGYALAIIPPTGKGREPVFPAEIAFQSMALVGRVYRDPRYNPDSNGCFGITFWPMHAGDMMDPHNPGKGTLPSFPCFTGVDDRGNFFGWSQFRSWLDDAAGNSVVYDAHATFGRNTQLTQVTATTAATVFQTHRLPAVAMRARNSKDYPVNASFPLSNAAQYAYDRVVRYVASGNYQNGTGAAANVRLLIKVGGELPTTVFDSGNVLLPFSRSYGSWRFEGDLTLSASGSQNFYGRFTVGTAGDAAGVAREPLATRVANADGIAVDMTVDQFLTATVQPGAAGIVFNAERSTIQVQ